MSDLNAKTSILHVSDKSSSLFMFRGRHMIDNMIDRFGGRQNIEVRYMSSDSITVNDITNSEANVIWLDNIQKVRGSKLVGDAILDKMNALAPGWKEKLDALQGEEADKYLAELDANRRKSLRIVYQLDEFVWEGPVARGRDILSVKSVESLLNSADTVVVPTPELRDLMYDIGVIPEDKEVVVVQTAVNGNIFPIFKNHKQYRDKNVKRKLKVLVKGVVIPTNVQQFVSTYYKDVDFTICSVGDLNDFIIGQIALHQKSSGKTGIGYIQHWASPLVKPGTQEVTVQIERDSGFDFVFHCRPSLAEITEKDLRYEICDGDEDIINTIAYGAVPIVGLKTEDDKPLYDPEKTAFYASKLTFNENTPYKELFHMLVRNNEASEWSRRYDMCRQAIEGRLDNAGQVFATVIGKEASMAIAEAAKKVAAETENTTEK